MHAISTLGCCYADSGHGVSPDLAEAARLWRSAAELGHPHAQYNLACSYAEGRGVPRDPAEAEVVRWLRLAVAQGNDEVQHALGRCYANGDLVARDPEEAARLYQLAAAQGHVAAQLSLAHMYRDGTGVAYDYAEVEKRTARPCGGSRLVARFCGDGCLRGAWAGHKRHCKVWAAQGHAAAEAPQ